MKTKALQQYIKDKHTQEECIGFIDGYEAKKEEDSVASYYASYYYFVIGLAIGPSLYNLFVYLLN